MSSKEEYIAALAALKTLDDKILSIYYVLYRYSMQSGGDAEHKIKIKNYLISNMFHVNSDADYGYNSEPPRSML